MHHAAESRTHSRPDAPRPQPHKVMPSRAGQGLTVAEAADGFLAYLETYRRSSPATLTAYAGDLRKLGQFLAAAGRPTTVAQIGPRDIQAFAYSLREAAPASVNRTLNAASSFFGHLERQGAVARNPVREVERPRIPERLPTVPALADVRQLVDAARSARERSMMLLLACCGLRRSELLNLQVGDLSADLSDLTVRQGKGARDRVVPIPHQARGALQAYLAEGGGRAGPLFTTRDGTRIGNTGFYRIFSRMVKRAGLADAGITPHSLRHYCATALLRGRADIETVRTILGHADLRTTQAYVHSDPASRREAVDRLPLLVPAENDECESQGVIGHE